MSSLPELTHLLVKIAGEVRRSNAVDLSFEEDENSVTSRAIAALTKSLNSGDHSSSSIRVLDAAVSLMCLKTTEVLLISPTSFPTSLRTLISNFLESAGLQRSDQAPHWDHDISAPFVSFLQNLAFREIGSRTIASWVFDLLWRLRWTYESWRRCAWKSSAEQ